MNLATACLVLIAIQMGMGLGKLKACLDALGVPASEYSSVDLAALKAALKGEAE